MIIPYFLLACVGLFRLSNAQDCGAFLIDDCQRDACPFRNEENIGSISLCQLLCELGDVDGESCKSWAYHEELKVMMKYCTYNFL